jgi:RNA-directed DNA polymerase
MIKKRIKALKIKDVVHLAKHLGTSPNELQKICNNIALSPKKYYFQWDKKFRNGKIRPMVKVFGRLREILDRLNYLLQHIDLPPYVHGGVPGRSTRTNAKPHLEKPLLVTIDLENHFPRVSPGRVYSMFRYSQDCSPQVAAILTQLTTLNGRLPQGSPTSTSVSNLVTLGLSKRLHNFAKVRGVDFTQYIDDYSFSGGNRLSRYTEKVEMIASQEYFKINPSKTEICNASSEQIVTGIRVTGSRPDVPSEKIKEVRRSIAELAALTSSGNYIPRTYLKSLQGKIAYIRSLNRGSAKFLQRKLDHIKSVTSLKLKN